MVNKSPVHVVEAKYSLEPSLDPKIPIRNKIQITKYKSTSIQDFQTTLFMLSIYLPAVVTHLFIFSPSWLSCMLCMSVWIYRLLGTWQGPVNISYPMCSLCNCFRRYTNRSSTEPRLYRNSLVVIHGNYFGPSCMDFPGHFPEIILGRLQHNFLCQIVSFIHWPHFSPVLYTIWLPEIGWTRNKLHGKEEKDLFWQWKTGALLIQLNNYCRLGAGVEFILHGAQLTDIWRGNSYVMILTLLLYPDVREWTRDSLWPSRCTLFI